MGVNVTEGTTPSAKIVADSIAPSGHRLTTFELEFHRFVLAEFNTHRVFSRNSASSRAIPVAKQLARASEDPAFPIKWPAEQPGMQGGSELEGWDLEAAQGAFRSFQDETTSNIQHYLQAVADQYGLSWDSEDPDEIAELKSHTLHKSLLNRLIEPIMWHKVIVTAAEYENFYRQRVSPLAQPEIEVAAAAMQALMESEPVELAYDDWHTPYISDEEKAAHDVEIIKRVSVARCARVSYLTHDGVRDIEVDLGLYEKLVSADPPHWSPTEHVAVPDPDNVFNVYEYHEEIGDAVPAGQVPILGNFVGFRQMRHEFKFWEFAT